MEMLEASCNSGDQLLQLMKHKGGLSVLGRRGGGSPGDGGNVSI